MGGGTGTNGHCYGLLAFAGGRHPRAPRGSQAGWVPRRAPARLKLGHRTGLRATFAPRLLRSLRASSRYFAGEST